MKDKRSWKFVLCHKRYSGGFWKSLCRLFGEDSNLRWWWEIVDDRGSIIVRSICTYRTEASALAAALLVGKFILEFQAYNVRKVK